MNLRKAVKESDLSLFATTRAVYRLVWSFKIPAPRVISRPVWLMLAALRNIYYWAIGAFWVTPLYHGLCARIGKNFSAGSFLPYTQGSGRIHLGDNVKIYGKVDFFFGSILDEVPEIYIGNNSRIGHNVTFDVSGKLVVGERCLIASGVTIQDCGGHPIDAESRRIGLPAARGQVKPITIGNNVWIGAGPYVFAGSRIEDNCVISARTLVGRAIPANHLAYPAPSQIVKIRDISRFHRGKQPES